MAYAKLRDIADDLDNKHNQQWREYWESGRIEVKGDLALRKVLYASQYYIKSSLPAPETDQRQNEFYGVSPAGLGKSLLVVVRELEMN